MSDHVEAPNASSVTSIRNARRGEILEATGDLAIECAACHAEIGTQETCAVWTRGPFIVTAHLACVEGPRTRVLSSAIEATP